MGVAIKYKKETIKGKKEFNLGLGRDIEADGGRVVYISIKKIRPKALSRIEKVEVESLV